MYKITFKDSASKELQRLSKSVITKIVSAINELSENPRPSGVKKLKDSNENLYRIRVGDYRIIYVIDDGLKL
jgi:mRNA interferase RelE/StbE